MKFQRDSGFQRHSVNQGQRAIPTIGMLCGSLDTAYIADIWKGVVEAAHHHRVNLLCFRDDKMPVSSLKDRRFDAPYETLYEMVDEELIDGLLVIGPDVVQGGDDEVRRLCASYAPLPLMTIATSFPGIPGILTDNARGLQDVTRHLIDVHGYRRIAYMKLPIDTDEVRQRYDAYLGVLQDADIASDPHLVIQGGYETIDGERAVRMLLDDRGLQPGQDFDAIVAANDFSAVGAMQELQKRGMRVPYDVAVIGYDDTDVARLTIPPLTTVKQPIYELGYRAVELMLAGLSGDDIPELTVLPTLAVVRLSCGCVFDSVTHVIQAAPEASDRSGMDPKVLVDALTPHYDEFCVEIVRLLVHHDEQEARNWIDDLLRALISDVAVVDDITVADDRAITDGGVSGTASRFLQTLDDILLRFKRYGGDVGVWHRVPTLMRRYGTPYLDDAALARAENLWQQARVLITDTVERVFTDQLWQEEQQLYESLDASQNLSKAQNVESILQSLAEGLAYLRIPSGFLSLYEVPEDPNGFSRLMLAYHASTGQDLSDRIDVTPKGRRFLSRQLLPDNDFPHDRPVCLLVGALFFDAERLGHVVFEIGPLNGDIYETFCRQLSSALKSEQLLQAHLRAREILALQPIIEKMLDVASRLGQASDELGNISSQMATGAEQTMQQASSVSTKSRDIGRILRDMSKGVEEEAANIQEISATVTKVSNIITQAVATANAANETMDSLETHSQQIGNIIKTITDIAEQIDLLALNATIKAAQAGDYGRGFAVVAGKVKDLAGEASQAAEDIEQRISTIQINSLDAANAITQVVQSIRDVSEQSGSIASATTQQTATTNEISNTITQVVLEGEGISQAMTEVVKATQKSSVRAAHVQKEAVELSSIAKELRQLVQEVQMEINTKQIKRQL